MYSRMSFPLTWESMSLITSSMPSGTCTFFLGMKSEWLSLPLPLPSASFAALNSLDLGPRRNALKRRREDDDDADADGRGRREDSVDPTMANDLRRIIEDIF